MPKKKIYLLDTLRPETRDKKKEMGEKSERTRVSVVSTMLVRLLEKKSLFIYELFYFTLRTKSETFFLLFLSRFINSLQTNRKNNNIETARKNQILLLVLACNYKRIACNPGIVESNIDLKRFRENREKSSDAISTKLASTYKNNHHNFIGKNHEKSEKFVPMPSPFQPLHLTRDDVVTSGVPNQHYSHESQQTGGDEFNQLSAATSSPPTLVNNGEVIFAIHHSQNSQSSPQFTSAGSFDLRNYPSYRHV